MKKYVHYFIILLIIAIFCLLFANHFTTVFTDRGREFLIPLEILKGSVPYKDINLIYFPLAFYINALIYKILGVSINSLLYTQIALCSAFLIGYYILAKEFIKPKTALILTIFLIPVCIFAKNDLFGFLVPYSFSRFYGMLSAFFCVFSIIKLYKTDNIKFACLASALAGFSLCSKIEFVTAPVILLIGLLLYKKLPISQYLKIFASFLIFPIITISVLFLQGVSIQNISDAIKFGIEFSQTDVITEFLSQAGVYPLDLGQKLKIAFGYIPIPVMIIILCFITLKFKQKLPKLPILTLGIAIIYYLYYKKSTITEFWLILPLIMWFLLCFKAEYLYKNDRNLLFLIISSLLVAQREFFRLCLHFYGTYSFALLILALVSYMYKFFPKKISDLKLEKLINYVFIVLIVFYTSNSWTARTDTRYTVATNKGTFYTKQKTAFVLNQTLDYIENNTDKNAKILVLPEGNIINFLTDRKVDMHCFMMDRLYHDAYGQYDAKNAIENTKSDYIILVKGFDLQYFHKPYLFENDETPSAKYIHNNYTQIAEFEKWNSSIQILKKNL